MIQEWVQNPTPESSRHLIRAYRESEWRSVRLEVLKGLHKFTDLRSFLFLVEVIRKNEDLAEQMLAIRALAERSSGSMRSRSVQCFLRSYLPTAPDTLKPTVAYSLGLTQDFHSISLLLKEWDPAVKNEDGLLLKNLVIALGELKAFESLPKIRELLARSSGLESDLMMACMFALARLERDPGLIAPFERAFSEDSLMLQIYRSTLSQIQIRSQFKLEDYLSKIFQHPNPHPVLPLELRAFDEKEVETGLEVFDAKAQPKRFLFALQGLRTNTRAKILKQWFRSMIQSDQGGGNMSEDEWEALIPDISSLLNDTIYKSVKDEIASLKEPASLDLQLKWLDAIAPYVDIEAEGRTFLVDTEDSIAIRYLNLWSEWSLVKGLNSKVIDEWIDKFGLKPMVFGRLIRACAELNHPLKKFSQNWPTDFKDRQLRSSVLFYFESQPELMDLKELLNQVLLLSQLERENLGQRILGVIEAIAEMNARAKKSMAGESRLIDVLKMFAGHFSPELQIGVLRTLRFQPIPGFESWVMERIKHAHALVELNSIIALKSYPNSRDASEALVEKLDSAVRIIQGRALDSLCAHTSLLARRAVLDYLMANLDEEEVVDKVYRSFDPENRGGPEFVQKCDAMLQVNPDHPQWEKLVSLRDRLSNNSTAAQAATLDAAGTATLEEIDKKLVSVIPHFKKLDAMTQSALRAAEQPFIDEDTHKLPVDKAPTVLEYCKALDLILDRHLGQKYLFPRLDTQLHDFQTLWHRLGFGEDYPNLEKVVTALGLKGRIAPEHFPLHKAKMMCGTFFNGKILQDRFKIFDGLRAWAVIFLMFTRKLPVASTSGAKAGEPLLKLANSSDEKAVSIAKRLMTLQDLRNPAAHRQTYMDLASVSAVRNEAILLLNTVLEVLV
ncbi:MAG: hypothetical protein JST80_02445 [Bdellovibrionales bacterium]|nr:hypothetical protein [Bdellovibrionales bacterium]